MFVNCAFDAQYQPLFYGIVFTIVRSGFRARCALEADDALESRFIKIQSIIGECRYSIHDISRTELDGVPPLPRFNMPLELGVFIGAKRYGGAPHADKRALILDTVPYRYQRFISDIAGQDIQYHNGNVVDAITKTASWLRNKSRRTTVPGGAAISAEYELFQADLPNILNGLGLQEHEVTFSDYLTLIESFITE
ncbi:MAG: hypothetical protein ACOH2L_04045 [Devosia sp.]